MGLNRIFRKQKLQIAYSPGRIVWNNFLKNKSALVGIIVILGTIFIAVFAYQFAPDKSPNANKQYLELAAKKPGFKVSLLRVRGNTNPIKKSFFKEFFLGSRSDFTDIPINSYRFDGSQLIAETYNNDISGSSREVSYNVADVVFSLYDKNKVEEIGDNIKYLDISGAENIVPIEEIRLLIIKKHILKKRFLLGTDRFGRDLLSRLIIGARISLAVGFISVFISLLIGLSLGIIAGYYRGFIDNVILWLINVIWSIPTLLLVIAISMALGKGFWQVFIAVGMTMWVEVARVTRGQVMSIREKEYVEAGVALGYSNFRILTRHILPNIMSPIIVISAANFASAILVEAGLSFLGIGVQPPIPSWGGMIKDHYAYIIVDQAYLAIIPGVAIMVLVLAFTMAGNGLRDAFDKKS